MILGIIRGLAIVVFMYLSWRNLRDNYKEENLIKFLWLLVIAYLLGGRIGYGLVNWGVWNENIMDWFLVWKTPGINYLIASISMLVMSIFLSIKNEWKIMQVLEDIIVYILLLNGIFYFDEFIRTKWELKSGLIVLSLFIVGILGMFVKTKYRSFFWYTSGKKGFIFYFNLIVLSILMALISFFVKENVIFVVVYLLIALISMIGLLLLGGVFESLLLIFKRRKK